MIAHHHPGYSRLEGVDDSALLDQGLVIAGPARTFMNPADDISIGNFGPPPG